jgi:Aspartyl/Asparaginyl beta-hydroxylase
VSRVGDPELDRVVQVPGELAPPDVGFRVLEILQRRHGADSRGVERLGVWCSDLARRLRGESTRLPEDPLQRPTILYLNGFADHAWHDPAQHPITSVLEAAAAAIRSELSDETRASGRWREYAEGVGGQKWRARWFYRHGLRLRETAALYPRTSALIDEHSGGDGALASTLGDTFISRLEPGGHIPAHNGLCNISLVCHLALSVPEGCRFRVGTSSRSWVEGKCFVFDDTFEHEAWNESADDRYVLVLPLWQNGVSPIEREFMTHMTSWLNRLTAAHENA